MSDSALAASHQRLILTHSLFVGLTPLIPVPFADDLAMSYFQRRCIRLLASEYGVTLSESDIEILADGPGGGFFTGLFKKILLFPVKLLSRTVRKLLIVLEYKRMADVMSVAYHQAYLFEYVLQTAWRSPDALRDAKSARRAIDVACQSVGVVPVGFAFQTVLRHSKIGLLNVSDALAAAFRNQNARSASEASARETAEERAASSLIERLGQGLRSIPAAHFQRLRSAVDIELFGVIPPKG